MDPRKRRADFWSITTWVLLAILAIFLVLPIGRLLKEAVYTDGHFSLDAFQKFRIIKPLHHILISDKFFIVFACNPKLLITLTDCLDRIIIIRHRTWHLFRTSGI